MHGLSIYEIKRICDRAYLYIISSGSFQHLTNFLNRWKNNTSPKYRAKIVVIFSQLLSINLDYIAHDLKPFSKCASLFVIRFLARYGMIYLAIRRKFEFVFRINHIHLTTLISVHI